jgi:hypothetical protein
VWSIDADPDGLHDGGMDADLLFAWRSALRSTWRAIADARRPGEG